MGLPSDSGPSTTTDVAAQAQTRELGRVPSREVALPQPGEGVDYDIGKSVERACALRPHERQAGDPIYRPLRIFALDPAASDLDGSIAVVNVPYEPLQPGPEGALFSVEPFDRGEGQRYGPLNPDESTFLLTSGRRPAASDPLFHQQSVYAVASVVYASFKTALGRHLAWGFGPRSDGKAQLRLVPNAEKGLRNAYYDKESGEIRFGYYQASTKVTGRNLPGGYVFTCLSHDVVAHEVTHALLDGLRSHFDVPTSADTIAFHEALADLVAIFQRFSFPRVVESAIRRSRGEVRTAGLLTDLAEQFGHTIGKKCALRTAIDRPGSTQRVYREGLEVHELGSVLVSAVFHAFATLFERRTERYRRLATNGTGVLPPGELPADLQLLLAEDASHLASQFLRLCIRAVDYCPPVDLRLGEFLRAVITADRDLVPDDRLSYREAWIDAFWQRDLYPPNIGFLSEESLSWEPPPEQVKIEALTFAELRFDGEPGRPASMPELRRQAGALGRIVTQPRQLGNFGLARTGDPRLRGDEVERPCVQSVRSSRRVGPDGQVVFDLVAEVTQARLIRRRGRPSADFLGGSTVIVGPDGKIRYVIAKSVLNARRLEAQQEFVAGDGKRLWKPLGEKLVPRTGLFKMVHDTTGNEHG